MSSPPHVVQYVLCPCHSAFEKRPSRLLGSKRQARISLDIYILVILVSKVLLGAKRQARISLDIYILVILVSKQFAMFLHISLILIPLGR